MPHEGQQLEGRNGYRLIFTSISDELLMMEARYAGRGDRPPKHHHPRQDEHFEVREGAVRVTVDGEERRYGAGAAARRWRRRRAGRVFLPATFMLGCKEGDP